LIDENTMHWFLYQSPHDIHEQPGQQKDFTVHPNFALASFDENDLIMMTPFFMGISWFHSVPPEFIFYGQ
jgi:hypothetical protein